jgi:hypothetical protein
VRSFFPCSLMRPHHQSTLSECSLSTVSTLAITLSMKRARPSSLARSSQRQGSRGWPCPLISCLSAASGLEERGCGRDR